uniref:Uncharacterized protein n=1 Tax=Vitrella brassicaformis TaxID=1169539 RepID=A0A7S1K7S9_9ALVE|mmetsp:Transcript_41038/g.102517  ORF Transcript_41038/g.102517 Transcript_41038/m.102517 type:complete len:337 (+) Transcript_41038:110-1120(+)
MNIVPVPMEGSAAVPTGYYPSGSASHTRPDSSSGVKHSYLHERLQSSSIAMSPVCVIVTFVAIGCLFITLGATIMALSGDVVHCVVPYEYSGEAVYRWVKVTSKDCEPENGVEELKEPVYVYYQLEDFYQNHRKYVKSRSDAQLEGNWRGQESMIKNCEPRRNVFDLFDVETDDATRRKERSKHTCDALDRTGQGPDEPTYTLPYGRTFNKSTQTIDQPLPPIENCDALLYPCGLIATTVFTDSYRLYDATQEMDNLTASEGSPAPLATGDEDEDEDDEEKYAENAWLSNETVAEAAERAGVSVAAAARKVDTRAETIAWKADVERFKNIKFDHVS